MKPSHLHRLCHACLVVICALTASSAFADAKPERFKAADSEGVHATRYGNILTLKIDADAKQPITIPRLAAPLRSIAWDGVEAGQDNGHGLGLKPKPATWVIDWKSRPQDATTLVLEFDAPPLLMKELGPIKPGSDGSFYLPAHLAKTTGENIRYEPQPNKNTVGYWTAVEDSATWSFAVDKPGRFNIAVLQGCGKGQGGSTARVLFNRDKIEEDVYALEFVVQETGHFQDFRWRHMGVVDLDSADLYGLKVEPTNINKAALMDIRAIHLIRLPDKK